MAIDSVLETTWLAAANTRDVPPGGALGVRMIDREIVVWRTADGVLSAAVDQCPHRGTQLSTGQVRGDCLQCPYHGWEYDASGACRFQPASPGTAPAGNIRLQTFAVCERYGVVWVCLDKPATGEPCFFREYEEPGTRHVHHVPRLIAAPGPRIIENFLDMSHFPFVHPGTLGEVPRTEVRDYDVRVTEAGVEATNCYFWQPAATPTTTGGADVEYSYRVPHPLVATLTKVPQGDAPGFSLMLVASPVTELQCRAWMVAAFTDPTVDEQDFHDFNEQIFMQDIPILEAQRPRLYPIDPKAEHHHRADRLALAYRRWLTTVGFTYGTSRVGHAAVDA